jgi:hypothetical protein
MAAAQQAVTTAAAAAAAAASAASAGQAGAAAQTPPQPSAMALLDQFAARAEDVFRQLAESTAVPYGLAQALSDRAELEKLLDDFERTAREQKIDQIILGPAQPPDNLEAAAEEIKQQLTSAPEAVKRMQRAVAAAESVFEAALARRPQAGVGGGGFGAQGSASAASVDR